MNEFIPWRNDRKLNLVQIQTTSVCNSNCICCPYPHSWYKKNPGYMSDGLYRKIVDSINKYDPMFTGKFAPYLCNEPYADKKILRRCETAYDRLKEPYVELSSNMGLLDKKMIDDTYEMFKKHNFYGKFTISHHGINKESFEKFMGLPYEKCLDNMIYLLQKFDGQLKISIQDMAYSLDKKFQMNPYRSVSRYLERIIDDNSINRNNLVTEPKVFHNRAGNVKIDNWDYDEVYRTNLKGFNCIRLMGCLHVLYTGETILCCMDYFRETVMTNLNKMSVPKHFDSDEWIDMIEMVQGYKVSPKNFICKRCMSPGG